MKTLIQFVAVALIAAVAGVLVAKAQGPAIGFSKKNYNFSAWTKGRFSEMVSMPASLASMAATKRSTGG